MRLLVPAMKPNSSKLAGTPLGNAGPGSKDGGFNDYGWLGRSLFI
jgi:hypothetical protein